MLHDFKYPPLDGSLTIPEIWDWHFIHNAKHPVFQFRSPGGSDVALSYGDVVPAAYRAADFLISALQSGHKDSSGLRIAIIAATDTITFFCTVLGATRAGICVAIISPRNTPAAVAHLLREVDASHVFISVEQSIRQLVEEACHLVAGSGEQRIQISDMPRYEDIMSLADSQLNPPARLRPYELDSPVVYTHSSGSTSLPKPIAWNHTFLLQVGMAPVFGAHNYCNQIFAFHCVSMTHGTGTHLLSWIATTGMIVATFPPLSPARFPSSDATYEGLVQSRADYLLSFPHYIEAWSDDPAKVDVMKSLKGLIYVGGFLNHSIGLLLASQGVKLHPLYGMAEAGVLGSFLPVNQGTEWEYFSMTPHSGATFVPAAEGLYELILVQSPTKHLAVTNSVYNGSKAYVTRDLFVKHPDKEGFWKPVGRMDDLILHSNGKKTNPLPLEHVLNHDPRVQGALVFGQHRLQCGALIELSPELAFDTTDRDQVNKMRAVLRSKLDEANALAPSHSKLYPEMVLFANPAKPFSYTEKGSVRRGQVLQSYKNEIDALYERPLDEFPTELPLPASWTPDDTLQFVRNVVAYVLADIGDSDDLFHYGCDSLQAARVEYIICQAMRKTGISLDGAEFQNFVYSHPTPYALSSFVSSIASQCKPLETSSDGKTIQAILTRFAAGIRTAPPDKASPLPRKYNEDAVFLVTGTTGRLGANVLSQLYHDQRVKHVYALNRCRVGETVERKQEQALEEHGLDPAISRASNITLLRGDLRNSGFGLDNGVQAKLRRDVTHIIHLAWPVDWKMKLPSFDGMLGGVVNLINFALSSERDHLPRFLFASSVGVFHNTQEGSVIPEQPLEKLDVADGQGYSESKAIAERLLSLAAELSPLRPVIVRLGQVSGSANGAWKTTEWVPALVKSSITLGSLPVASTNASWIPAEVAGRAIVDLSEATVPIVHLIHPKPISAAYIMQVIGRELRLPLIPYNKWLTQLEDLKPSAEDRVPALKILDFYRHYGLKDIHIQDQLGSTLSPALASASPLDDATIVKWIEYWKKSGLL